MIVLVGFFGLKSQRLSKEKPPETGETPSVPQKISLSVLDVYLSESEDPSTVYLNMRVKWQPAKGIGAPSCDIYFPAQEGMEQGIGPIENGCNFVVPLNDKEDAPVKEAILKEEIARSYYPDHVAPEFGKEYFAKIKFYWSFGNLQEWEGKVGWKKSSNEKKEVPMTKGTTSGTGQATVSFSARPSMPSWEEELHNEWVPSFQCSVIWGYRVLVNNNFYGDFPAVYTPVAANAYILTDPQSITLRLSPGTYYVEIFPLGIFYSPNLVTTDGRRYAFKKTSPDIFLWAWIDNKGNPTSPWQSLSEIPKSYGSISWPGYYFINRAVFSNWVEVKTTGGGGGGGGGLFQ